MKHVLTAAIFAIAFTGTASADDNYSDGYYGNNSYTTAEKPNYPVKKYKKDIKVSEDPNPSKLKRELEFFEQFTVRD